MIPIEDLLRLMIDESASDLHLTVGAPPVLRINGRLVRLKAELLTHEDMENIAGFLLSEFNRQRLAEEGTVDFATAYKDQARFRVSAFKQREHLAFAIRIIPRHILSPDEIGLPDSVLNLLDAPRGLILVTGPTGSGKSTSLASMLDRINRTHASHIVTIEDPIEYYHEHQLGIVNQREIGVDVPYFSEALRRVLRQDPDVILVGEMRDLETMEAAITAAETGHLVFSTLHTTGAARTVDRIIDAFPDDKQEQIRIQLAANLKAVISQLLLPTTDENSRVAVFEVMIQTHSISTLIRENKTFRIGNEILTGSKYGMVSLEASLINLYAKGKISIETVLTKAQDPEVVRQLLETQ